MIYPRFAQSKKIWSIVGCITASINQTNMTTTEAGTGILSCKHEIGKYGIEKDIVTIMEQEDIDLDLDFMMAKGSNSGIYLRGHYEIQLNDIWAKKNPKFGDFGEIFERKRLKVIR